MIITTVHSYVVITVDFVLKSDDDTCLPITMQATSVIVFSICLCYIESFPADAMIGIEFPGTERNERDAVEPKLIGVRDFNGL
ncbi:unnamed protein product [Cylicostephanus goldi]|uniref:Uncharacterized protein n=1 Tax=Cylicostephanus goldi TaxID=71465 RepID=A0A3P7QXS9_CYLGO|nr:unnamed protein product [Cylicostephanus goldi]